MPAMYLKTNFKYKITVKDFPNRKLTNQQILEQYTNSESDFDTTLDLYYLDNDESNRIKDQLKIVGFSFTRNDLIDGEMTFKIEGNDIVVTVNGVIKFSVVKNFVDLFLDENSKWGFGGVRGEPWQNDIGDYEEDDAAYTIEVIEGGEMFINKYMNPFRKIEEEQEFTLLKVTTSNKKIK